ncbi:PAS domain S-box protein (plasmid) [Paracoccus liaowanqingii]|uniref:PAS domain S-box protein n=1 Tax=Paracoccus liaowanqingii TaxID=2560053 RepID=A0A4Y5SRT9_9RHOB|nr:PAS domain S-box protein [Paracoccus liaowanqingii]QDA36191.1 PAS domain S-box protein [Paracoccus liaowanqingii]
MKNAKETAGMMVADRTIPGSTPAPVLETCAMRDPGAGEALLSTVPVEVLGSLLDGLPYPVQVKDLHHRLLWVNEAMCTLLGQSREQMLARSDCNFCREEQACSCRISDDEVFATGQEVEYEKELITPAGSVRLIRFRKRLVSAPGPMGVAPFLLTSLQDGTDSRRAEMALQESEASFRRLADDAPVIIWMSDASGAVVFVNRLWCDTTGQNQEEARGQGWLEVIHPDDQEKVGHIFANASARHEPYQAEYRLQLADGSWAWVLDIGQPRFADDGTFQGYVGCGLDITERRKVEAALRESEEHYRYSVELNPQIPWTSDPEGGIIDLPNRWCDMTGMSREETLGQGWTMALHPEDGRTVLEHFGAGLTHGVPVDAEGRLRGADGTYRWFRIRGAPRRDTSGHILRWYGSSEDIHDHKQAMLTLQERERQLQTVFNQAVVGIVHHDRSNRVLMINQRFREILGRTREELDGISLLQFTHLEDAERQALLLQEHRHTGEPLQLEKRYVRPDGSVVWCNVNISFVRDEAGDITGTIAVAEDITAHKQAEERAREAQNLLQDVIDSVDDLIYVKDCSGRYIVANRTFGGPEVLGKCDQDLFSQEIAEKYRQDDHHVLVSGSKLSVEEDFPNDITRRYHTVKAPWRRNDDIIGVIGISRDITMRKQAEERLQWAADHDELTDLPNRRLFQEKIKQAFLAAFLTQRRVGLLAIDVDHFKQINDRFGHSTGDAFLKGFAERLCQVVGDQSLTARVGGDEFAVLLPEVCSETDVSTMAKAILDHLQEPISLNSNLLDCRTSIGGAVTVPGFDGEPDELCKQADIALYASKTAGRSVFTMFRSSMREELQKAGSALRVAGQAVAFDWLVPYYQPKVDLASGKVDGFEALLRWNHPDSGIQSPDAIAPAFDNTDLGIAIGGRIRSCVLQHLRAWYDTGIKTGRIAINVSSAEFRRDDYAERVLDELSRAGLPTSCLEIEVTEGVFLGYGSEFVERSLHKLIAAGVTIALDDFGTGYASLSHLKQFPVHVLKIDRSFVDGLVTNASDAAVVNAVLSLGQNLGIRTVAEGVETAAQAALLRDQGCSTAQGFYFGRPMAASDVPRFISSWNDWERR